MKYRYNLKEATKKECETGSVIWYGECSYIKAVKWDVFINNYSVRIEKACEKQVTLIITKYVKKYDECLLPNVI